MLSIIKCDRHCWANTRYTKIKKIKPWQQQSSSSGEGSNLTDLGQTIAI